MKISLKEWIIFTLLAVLCLGLWYRLEYNRFSFVDLSIDKQNALEKAEAYLAGRGIDPKEYLKAVVFQVDDWSDRYLQKTLGQNQQKDFIKREGYELFFWQIRFFKELQKEEYVVWISAKDAQILSFKHLIEDIEPRETQEKITARQRAEKFLESFYGLKLEEYEFHEEKIKRFDNRTDYSFFWEKKGVYVPWREDEGGAKLLIGTTVSGDEIREFYLNRLDIPEKFHRYIEDQLSFGSLLTGISFILYMLLVTSSIFVVIRRSEALVIRQSKRFYLWLIAFIIVINIIHVFNSLQSIIINYSTSTKIFSFAGIYLVELVINLLFLGVAFVIPGLAGEVLRPEVLPDNKYSSFLHYIKSTFYNKGVAVSIVFGYLLFFILLGAQAVLLYLGQRYFGVWEEWVRLTQFSSAYLPFVGAFVIGVNASFKEEIIFRLFGITWAKKYLKNIILGIIFVSLIWGFAHSGYAVFPVWFRGIEVTLIGIMFAIIFIKYGILPLIVAHYLFDVFWGVASYILGRSPTYLYIGSIAALAVPLLFAFTALLLNKKEEEKEDEFFLTSAQRYNLQVLASFIKDKRSQGVSLADLRNDLIRHNWDDGLVDLALREIKE